MPGDKCVALVEQQLGEFGLSLSKHIVCIKVLQLQFYVTAVAFTSAFPEFPGMTFSHSRFPGIKNQFRE